MPEIYWKVDVLSETTYLTKCKNKDAIMNNKVIV